MKVFPPAAAGLFTVLLLFHFRIAGQASGFPYYCNKVMPVENN